MQHTDCGAGTLAATHAEGLAEAQPRNNPANPLRTTLSG